VHTQSNYATSLALLKRPLQVYPTAVADEWGSEIPSIPYVDNAGDHNGEAIVKYCNSVPAILLAHRGVIMFGSTLG
jgi:L-ribulose-5-phosphate 4-epimerase